MDTEDKFCPLCGNESLRFIETCESDFSTEKTSWTCDMCSELRDINNIIYIYIFKGES